MTHDPATDLPGHDTPQPGTTPPQTAQPPQPQQAAATGPLPFDELRLPDVLQQAIDDLGFTHCTPIQSAVLPSAIDGTDIIGKAQTGTGKTAAFLVTIITWHLEHPEVRQRRPGTPFALVVAPTRELAIQIAKDAAELTRHTDIRVVTLVGGMGYDSQRRQLEQRADVVVATPGRLLDFCRSGEANLSNVEILVLDEADRMLSMGFIPDVRQIVQRTPHKRNRQTLLFSATFSDDIYHLSKNWTFDPLMIEIEPEQVAAKTVRQYVYLTATDSKMKLVYNLVRRDDLERVMIFVNRRDETRRLYDWLMSREIECGLLTGEVPQNKRLATLEAFRNGKVRALVATDVAGRGIHVENVSCVINYNLPEDPEDYVHRIGRTGRAGAEGTSISLACEGDAFQLPDIEKLLGQPLDCLVPPDELLVEAPAATRKVNTDGLLNTDRDKSRSGRRSRRPARR